MIAKEKILLGIASYRGVEDYTCNYLMNLNRDPRIFAIGHERNNYYHFGRNKLTKKFLELHEQEGVTGLLTLDTDVVPLLPPKEFLDILLAIDAPMVSCPTWLYTEDKLYLNLSVGGQWISDLRAFDGAFEVDVAGAGCVFYRPEVFQAIPYPWYDTQTEEEISCDIVFSHYAAHYGFKYQSHPDLLCDHYKTLSLQKIANTIQNLRV
jgi:hypothetical protein